MASPEVLENLHKCHDALKGLQKELQPLLAQTESEHPQTRAIAKTAVALTLTTLSFSSHKLLNRPQRTQLRAELNKQRKLLVKLQKKKQAVSGSTKKQAPPKATQKEPPIKRNKH